MYLLNVSRNNINLCNYYCGWQLSVVVLLSYGTLFNYLMTSWIELIIPIVYYCRGNLVAPLVTMTASMCWPPLT